MHVHVHVHVRLAPFFPCLVQDATFTHPLLTSSTAPPQPLKSLRLTAPDAGPAFIEHCLLEEGFPPNARVNDGCDLSKGAQIAPKHAKLARDGERRREMEGDGETERDRGPPAYAHMHTHPYTRAHMHTHAPPPIPFLRECHHVLFRYAATATGTAER